MKFRSNLYLNTLWLYLYIVGEKCRVPYRDNVISYQSLIFHVHQVQFSEIIFSIDAEQMITNRAKKQLQYEIKCYIKYN